MHYLFVFWQRSDPAAAHSHSQPRFPTRFLRDVVNRRLEFGSSRPQVAEPRRCCDISALYPPSPLMPPWGEGCCRWMKGDQGSVNEIRNSCCLLQRDCFVVLRTGGCIHFGLRLSVLLPVWKAREPELSDLVFKEIIIRNITSWKCSKTRPKRGRNLLHADRVFVCCHRKMYKLSTNLLNYYTD